MRRVGLGDHTGDAYGDYEPLADAFLELRAENDRLRKRVESLTIDHRQMVEAAHREDDETDRLRKRVAELEGALYPLGEALNSGDGRDRP